MQDNWDFLYSLEIYRHKFEELWMITNILSQGQNLHKILQFYLKARATIVDILNINKYLLLDEVTVDYNSLHLIMSAVFQDKATTKMHLIQKLSSDSKGTRILNLSLYTSFRHFDRLADQPDQVLEFHKTQVHERGPPGPLDHQVFAGQTEVRVPLLGRQGPTRRQLGHQEQYSK